VTFSSADAEELGAVANRQVPGYAYGRLDNPTVVAFAAAVAELEGAEAGLACASGMGAIAAALLWDSSTRRPARLTPPATSATRQARLRRQGP